MKRSLGIICLLYFVTHHIAYSAIPNTSKPTTFLGPSLQLGITHPFRNKAAYSLSGQAGPKQLRLDGTIGLKLNDFERIKLSAEYLQQRINFAFFSGNNQQWVYQGAVGFGYQHYLENVPSHNLLFDFNTYASDAPSKNLSTVTGSYIVDDTTYNFVNNRHIAGSIATGVAPGVTVYATKNTKFNIALNYDYVRYFRKYNPRQTVAGVGTTLNLEQRFAHHIKADVSAAIRKPFNTYQVGLFWNPSQHWKIGIDGNYTLGKKQVPNTYDVGVNVNYFFDQKNTGWHAQKFRQDFLSWVSQSASNMPQVLVKADESLTTTQVPIEVCEAPVFSGDIDDQAGASTYTITTSTFFTGDDLTYSFSMEAPSNADINIDANTGDITVSCPGFCSSDVMVTATNGCGSATSNIFNVIGF